MDYSCCIHDCQSTYSDVDHIALEKVENDPRGVIDNVLACCKSTTEKPDSSLFRAIVFSVQINSQVRKAGASTLFIHCIVEGNEMHLDQVAEDEYIAYPCHWEMPLRGIVDLLHIVQADDESIKEELRQASSPIFNTIWRDLHRMLPPGGAAEYRRCLICQAILAFGEVLNMKETFMKDNTIVSLAMHCWMNMSTYSFNRQHALSAIHMILTEVQPTDLFIAHPPTLEKAVRAVTIDMVAFKLKESLSSGALVDDVLSSELRALCYFLTTPKEFSTAFTLIELFRDIAISLHRQLETGTPLFTPTVFNAGDRALSSLKSLGYSKHLYTEMARTGVLDVAAEGLVIADLNFSDHWHEFINKFAQIILHPCPETDNNCCLKSSPDYEPACREAMERLYCRIRAQLRDNQTESDGSALVIWDKFAHSLGINEIILQEKWRRKRLCANPRCDRRKEKSQKKVKTCIQCKSLFYCSKACQRSHWKEHKFNCNSSTPNNTVSIVRTKGQEVETLKRIIEHLDRSSR